MSLCNKQFETKIGHSKETTTCSIQCGNKYFKTTHGGCLDGNSECGYRGICFKHWDKRCAICGWDLIVDVHHIDRNHNNNNPKNLIPLCPNHHRMTQVPRCKDDVEKQIQNLVHKKWDGNSD